MDNSNKIRLTTLYIILLDVLISITINLTTSVLPEFIKNNLWIGWVILVILVLIYIFVTFNKANLESQDNEVNRLARDTLRKVSPPKNIFLRLNDLFLNIAQSFYISKDQIRAAKIINQLEHYSAAIREIEKECSLGNISKNTAEKAINHLRAEYRKSLI
jgi:hypothetical protein